MLERTQYLVPFARLGDYERSTLLSLTGPGRPWFEYWGHAASLMSVELYPLFRPRMEQFSHGGDEGSAVHRRRRAWRVAHADYLAAVHEEVAARGPLAASQLRDPRRRVGEWWDRRSDGRRALEVLFGDGVLAGWRTAGFERVYDLAERVIPRAALDAPVPTLAESERELLAIAARCLGVGTVSDLATHFFVRPPVARRRVAELVEAGRLLPVAVEGWGQPAYAPAEPLPRRPRRLGGTLLSPFDSLIWYRERTERLFGFRYRIEIYVPSHLRTHGYYVLPLLVGDQLVARFDLKSDRRSATLRVVAAHGEPGIAATAVVGAAVPELRALAAWLGLDRVSVGTKGDVAGPLARALR